MSINYTVKSPEHNRSIILLHGFMGQISDWDSIANKLSQHFKIISFDLPGHGASAIDSSCSIEKTAKQIQDILKNELKITKTNILGYSMGGRLTLELFKLYPTLFSRIIIESTHPGLSIIKDKEKRFNNDLKLLSNINSTKEFNNFLDNWYQAALWGQISKHPTYQNIITNKLKLNIDNLKLSLKCHSLGLQTNYFKYLQKTNCPILYMAGELDHKYIKLSVEIEKLNPLITKIAIPGAGHNSHFQNETFFLKSVENFLNE